MNVVSVDHILFKEIPYRDPIDYVAVFSNQNWTMFLDSSDASSQTHSTNRYSYLVTDPFMTLMSKDGDVEIDGKQIKACPFDLLQKYLNKYQVTNHCNLPPFQGGAVGNLAYDLFQHLENIPFPQKDDMQFPDLMLGFYDVVFSFDHQLKRAWIISTGLPESDCKKQLSRGKRRLEFFLEKVKHVSKKQVSNDSIVNIQSNFTKENYEATVKEVINYILEGDIFEANISQRFKTNLPSGFDKFALYQTLRRENPAPFSAYININDVNILSASPERFLQLKNNKIETRPIKGTIARGKDQVSDRENAKHLLNSEKDRSENIMIVDLMRNDLSRVCLDESVEVEQLCALESFQSVHHLVSVLTGKLKDQKTAVDLLKATFPGGSITGAPKIRAMEIISELEPTRRGPYCGCIGYLGFDGNMDMSIVIRTYAIKNNTLTFQAGGAVVLDSNPTHEYEESLLKAKKLIHVLEAELEVEKII